jgi:hypothetical protein
MNMSFICKSRKLFLNIGHHASTIVYVTLGIGIQGLKYD